MVNRSTGVFAFWWIVLMQCTSRTPAFGGAFWGNRSLVGVSSTFVFDSGGGRGGGPVCPGGGGGGPWSAGSGEAFDSLLFSNDSMNTV